MAIGTLPDNDGDGDADAAMFAEINITPLTDLFLVMLIIFMVSASLALSKQQKQTKQANEAIKEIKDKKSSGLKVDLQRGASRDIDPSSRSVIIQLDSEGRVAIDGKVLTLEQLETALTNAAARPDADKIFVVLQADKNVPTGRSLYIMDRAKQAGFGKFAFKTASN